MRDAEHPERKRIRLKDYDYSENGTYFVTMCTKNREPLLSHIVQGFKSVTTRRCFTLGFTKIWQHSFYDHIIRNEQEYLDIWEYIESNSFKWLEDEYYNS